jgi:hypothetical protein
MLDRPDTRGPARPPADPDRPLPVRYALCYTPLAGFHPPDRRVWREASCTDLLAHGAILLLDEEVPPNSVLTLELLPGTAPGQRLSRVSRLVQTVHGPEGGWVAACEFPLPLGAEEFARVGAAAVAPRPSAGAGFPGPHAPLGQCGEEDRPRHREGALFGGAEGPPH